MDAFARVAARFGVDPTNAAAVDRFFEREFPILDLAQREAIFAEILGAETPSRSEFDRPDEPRVASVREDEKPGFE